MGILTESGFASSYVFDGPESEDFTKKVLHTTKNATSLATVAALYDVMVFTNPVGIPAILNRMLGTWIFPAANVGAVYAATTCLAGSFRGKEGPLNHAIGGVAAGITYGCYRRCWKTAITYSAWLALLGSVYKAHKQDYKMDYKENLTRQQTIYLNKSYKQYPAPTEY